MKSYTITELIKEAGSLDTLIALSNSEELCLDMVVPKRISHLEEVMPWDAHLELCATSPVGLKWVGATGPSGGIRGITISIELLVTDKFNKI